MATQSKSGAKKAPAKKAAAKAASTSGEQATPDQSAEAARQTAQPGASSPAANSADSGPGTANPSPPKEDTLRPPATTVTVPPKSGPIEAPSDAKEQAKPEAGYDASSTDHTYAAAGGRTIAGETHVGLVDEDGKKVTKSSLFEDEDGKTFVTAKQRVFEVFTYPNTTEESKRLLFVAGQRVNRAEAARIEATLG